MARIILLGTGSAWSGPARENTYMLVEGESSRILVDCAGSPAQRLSAVKVDIASIDSVILTHTHPDHIYGWPIFVLNAKMAGRRTPVHVYGLGETLGAARRILRAFGREQWEGLFPLLYHSVPQSGINLIMTNEEFSVSATRTEHSVPTIALRFTSQRTGVSIAYSCDTSPCEQIVELASGVKYLIHEATTLDVSSPGHTSAAQAGAQARRAKAKGLVLVHLPPNVRPRLWRNAARAEFEGQVIVPRDLQQFGL